MWYDSRLVRRLARILLNALTVLSLLLCVAVAALWPAMGCREYDQRAAPGDDARFDPRWLDRSPHESRFVTLGDIRLHYLDWGGDGPVLLFLHGLGDSPHIFDDLAPAFADRFRVLGLTRRGHGRSDKPDDGYETATLAEDVRGFLDALKIARVTLVGHSIAGDELTAFSSTYPDRVDRLIYLDAAVSRAAMRDVLTGTPRPLQSPADLKSYEAFRRWLARVGYWSEAWEANVRETMILNESGALSGPVMPPNVSRCVMRASMEFRPDYTKITVPALSFATVGWSPAMDAYVRSLPRAERQGAEAFRDEKLVPFQRAEIDRFRRGVRNGRVVELPDTDHHCFIHRRDRVVRVMRSFLLSE